MKKRSFRGVTLIELLVVVTILVLLGAMVVPNITPSLEARRLREAARGLDVFCATAKARAIRNGRPVGVMITPLANNNRAALSFSIAEVPDVYAGDFFSSTAVVQAPAGGIGNLTAVMSEPLGLQDFIGQGDLIQFGQKGYMYRIVSLASDGKTMTIQTDTRGGMPQFTSAPGWSVPITYRIFRAPMIYSNAYGKVGLAGATATSYQMPEGVALDLTGTVFAGAPVSIPNAPDNTLSPITIVFSPTGGVSAIYANQAVRYLPQGPVHLLIGKLKNIQATTAIVPPIRNWQDVGNYYVSIGHLTGQITTTEVAPVDTAATLQQQLLQATAFTRDNYATGGR